MYGRAHGRVHDTYTAAYTCLRVYVYKGRVHGRNGRTRLCNVSCVRPCTGRYTAVYKGRLGRVYRR